MSPYVVIALVVIAWCAGALTMWRAARRASDGPRRQMRTAIVAPVPKVHVAAAGAPEIHVAPIGSPLTAPAGHSPWMRPTEVTE